MGYRLFRELVEHGPHDLPHAELWLWAVLADDANDTTRLSWMDRDTLSRRARLGRTRLLAAFRELARRGYELRLIRGKDRNGNAVYAHRGAQVTYRLPRLGDETSTEKGVGIPDTLPEERVSRGEERVSRYALKGVGVADTPSPQSPQIPSSSSSPSATNGHHRDDDEIIEWVRANRPAVHDPRGWVYKIRTTDPDGYDRLVAEATAVDHRAAWRAQREAAGDCGHGVLGGHLPHPDSGEPFCVSCRIEARRAAP